jgi:uncharacterized damage-inducible protein DinB
VEVLEGFPEDLKRIVFTDGVSPEDFLRPGSDGGWGVSEILPHLRDWEEIFLERTQRIINEDHPHIPGVDDSLWPIERDYRGQDPERVFASFQALREEHLALIRSLSAAAWNRTGEHSLFGTVSLHWMLNHVCDHDEEHLQQAREVLSG